MSTYSRSREVASLLDRTAASLFDAPLERVPIAFQEILEECAPLALDEDEILELKRRVVEWQLRLYCDKDASPELVKATWNDLNELGFSNLESEGGSTIYFAQYCIRNDDAEFARSILYGLKNRLARELQKEDVDVYRHFFETCETLL